MQHNKAVDGRQISKRGAARIKAEQRKDRQNRKRAARYRARVAG